MTIGAEAERVGPYRLIKAIGAGGSARIDLARLDRVYGFQRHVVIKRPLEHLREDERAAASLRREARIGGLLHHPNLVAVLDAGQHDGYDYLALEYVHGAPLRALMQTDAGPRVRDVPVAAALAIAAGVARALHHAHELADDGGAPLGLVHRDVSPGNVLVALDGAVKLADFGIAKETRVATLSGSMHGTVRYMAPEQCRGHAYDRRADVFSLGVICYELITGARLFWADNDVASLHRVLSGTVPRPREVRPEVAPVLEEIVMTAVAHDPEARFATAQALAEELEGFAAHAGLSLAARGIARWAREVLGPREAPWASHGDSLGSPGVAAAAAEEEGSLIELIVAVPEDEPPLATFGPTDEAALDTRATMPGGWAIAPPLPPPHVSEVEAAGHRTDPVPGAARGRRIALAALIAGGLGAGALAAIAMLGQAEEPAAASPTPPVAAPAPGAAPAPAPAPTPAPAVPAEEAPAAAAPDPAPVAAPEAESPVAAAADDPAPKRPIRKKHRPPTAPRVSTGSAAAPPADARSAEPRPPVAAEAGTPAQPPVSAARPARPKVKWSPTLMLPSDSGSGSGKRP